MFNVPGRHRLHLEYWPRRPACTVLHWKSSRHAAITGVSVTTIGSDPPRCARGGCSAAGRHPCQLRRRGSRTWSNSPHCRGSGQVLHRRVPHWSTDHRPRPYRTVLDRVPEPHDRRRNKASSAPASSRAGVVRRATWPLAPSTSTVSVWMEPALIGRFAPG